MTEKFNKCIPIILDHEGGYVNHKHDPGGATNYGISLRFLKKLGYNTSGELIGDTDKDGDVDADDIRIMTIDEAKHFYFQYFWKKEFELIGLDEVALHLFDMSVNAGVYRAVKLAQRITCATVDGIIGKETIKAINQEGQAYIYKYKQERKRYYHRLVDNNPKLKIFLNGWINRVESTEF